MTERDAQVAACREKALALLTRRAHSVGEISRKLMQRGFERAVRDHVVEDLVRVGLLDDAAFARAFCEQKTTGSRPLGRMRLIAELRRRHVSADVAEEAVRETFSEDDGLSEYEIALEAARARWNTLQRRPSKTVRQNRDALYRFLMSRGFGGEVCRQVFDALASEMRPD